MARDPEFGKRLRELRSKINKTMGQIARELGISTVYYSDVERGRRNPFPPGKVDYEKLARALNADAEELKRLAEVQRTRLHLNLSSADQETRDVAVVFARHINESTLNAEQLNQLKAILNKPAED